MIKLFFLLFSLWLSSGSFPPKGLDFEDKTLWKELQKAVELEGDVWKELLDLPELNSIQGKFLVLSGKQNQQKKYAYVGRVISCRQGGCSKPGLAISSETPEYFDYLIVFDAKPAVQMVKVYNYQATHGQEVSIKGWLRQYAGYDGSQPLTVGKDIDAISGATISVYAINQDIQEKTDLIRKICQSHKK